MTKFGTSLPFRGDVSNDRSYRKPMPAARLAQRIDAASFAQIRTVEGALAEFSMAIGLLAPEAG